MNTFTLRAHFNGIGTAVSARGVRDRYLIETPSGPVQVRTLGATVRRTAAEIGPVLAKAQATSSRWGLYVVAGGAQALFGEWGPAENPPHIQGDPRDHTSAIARIHDEWRNHDRSPRGALDAAMRIVEIYTERQAARAA
ncbi:MAG TPA: hypothetical protein VN458_07080 [Solirubrobacterales bacterium]|nr:hypothetical protein [Solirubrobacterales bacterium]